MNKETVNIIKTMDRQRQLHFVKIIAYLNLKNVKKICTKTGFVEDFFVDYGEFDHVNEGLPGCKMNSDLDDFKDELSGIRKLCNDFFAEQNKEPDMWLLYKNQLYRDTIGIIAKNKESILKNKETLNLDKLFLQVFGTAYRYDNEILTGEKVNPAILADLENDIKTRKESYSFLHKLQKGKITTKELRVFKSTVYIRHNKTLLPSEIDGVITDTLMDILTRLDPDIKDAFYFYYSSLVSYVSTAIKYESYAKIRREESKRQYERYIKAAISMVEQQDSEPDIFYYIACGNNKQQEKAWYYLEKMLEMDGRTKDCPYYIKVVRAYYKVKLNANQNVDNEVVNTINTDDTLTAEQRDLTADSIRQIRKRVRERIRSFINKQPKTYEILIGKLMELN